MAPRVLIVTFDFPPAVGGIQILVHRLALGLPTLRPIIVAPSVPEAAGFDVTLPIPVLRTPPDPSRGGVRRLACWLGMLGRALRAARRSRPLVVLCSHVIVAPIGWVIRRFLAVPYVVYVHADELPRLAGIRARTLREADGVIADSRYSRDLAVKVGAVAERIAVIGQGADAEPSPTGSTTGSGSASPTVLTIARMDELYKGQDVLIRSLPLVSARVPDVRLVLVGDGVFRSYYQRLARSLGVTNRVVFMGRVSDAERDRCLQDCDVFAMPSRINALDGAGEGFGVAYVEAAACGKPVLAGRVGGSLDSVVDGVTGVLVDPASVHEVADGLLRLLTDRDLARQLGEAGHRRVATELSWPQIGSRVEAALRDAAGRSEWPAG